MKYFLLLTVLVFASKNENDVESVAVNLGENIMKNMVENSVVVKIEEDEYFKKKNSSKYIGVSYKDEQSNWVVRRWSKTERKDIHNGSYKDEETAAHASDTLARELVANGEKNLKLNFPDDSTEVYAEKTKTSKFIGVSYIEKSRRWSAARRSKTEKKMIHNGYYRDEKTAAHASDALARKIMTNGEQNLKLNFPDYNTEVHPDRTKTSKYIGVSYIAKYKKWSVQRWSKTEKKVISNGYHKDEETAAHASDTLARELMENGRQNLKLNFTEENTEMQKNKRKRPFDLEYFQANENNFEKFEEN